MLTKRFLSTANVSIVHKLQFEQKQTHRAYSEQDARRRVVVTGMGIVSPIGCNVETAWDNILKGVCGIRKLEDNAFDNLPCKIAAKISENDLKLTDHLSRSEVKTVAPATAYALIAGNLTSGI